MCGRRLGTPWMQTILASSGALIIVPTRWRK